MTTQPFPTAPKIHRPGLAAAAFLTILALAAPARAEDRTVWVLLKQPEHTFRNTEGNRWTETFNDGKTVNFTEKERNEKYIEMWDKAGTGVRLYGDHYDVKPNTDNKWKQHYADGKWDPPYRKIWVAEGSYLRDLGDGNWHEVDPGAADAPDGADRKYKETARNATYIELKVVSDEQQWVRLYDKEIQVKNATAGDKDFGSLGAGRWLPKP